MDFKSRNDGAILGMHKCYHFDMNHVFTYDSTLRDGEQAEGISLSLEDKLLIVSCLDDFGIDFIEGETLARRVWHPRMIRGFAFFWKAERQS